MARNYLRRSFDFLRDPTKEFNSVKKEPLSESFKYMLLLSLIVGILSGIVVMFVSYPADPVFLMGAIVGAYLFTVVSTVLWSLWLHLWVYIFGARKGIEQTMRSVFYGFTPIYIIGWIPLVAYVSYVWALILNVMGLTRLQSMSGLRASLALVIAVGIPAAILAALLLWTLLVFGPVIFSYLGI